MSGNTLEDAIRDALDGYCNTRVAELVVALAFAVNTYLGRESNEGEKTARRKEAIHKIFQQGLAKDVGEEEFDKIISEAQG